MAEEVVDVGTSVESGDQSSAPVESSGSPGADLQDRMMSAEDHWFSDDINGYYGPDGQPVLNAQGEYVKTQEELNALLGNKTQTAKMSEPKQQVSQQKTDTLFETDGKYDPLKSKTFLDEIEKPYVPTFLQQPALPQQQAPQQAQAQQPQQEQQKTLSEQVLEYENGLRSNLLDPLIEARDDMIEAGRWNDGNPRAVKLNQLIQERTKVIDTLSKEKQLKLWEDSFNTKEKEKSAEIAEKELAEKVNQSLFTVSKKYNGQESFENLMLGKTDQSGKFIPGSGHDLVVAIVDLLYDGQQVSDIGKTTKDGWYKIAKNPEILSTIAKYVSGYHIAKNIAKNNTLVRQSAIAEERKRQTMVGKQPQSIVPSQQGDSGMPNDLAGWLGMSTV